MSSWLEFEGKNIESAVEKACEELNIPKEKLKHDVISFGSTGIFGLVGTKKARIRVKLHRSPSEKVSEKSIEEQQINDSCEQTVHEGHSPIQMNFNNHEINTFSDYPKELGRNVLQRIVDIITTDAEISVEEDSSRILFNIESKNPAVLIGKQGQTLEAIQYIVEKIVNKHNEERVYIQIDIEGYLKNRRASLRELAGRLAEKAKRTGKPMTVGQMSAHDRRIVHIALKNDDGVRTQSLGSGFLRKLMIFPKKQSFGKKRSD